MTLPARAASIRGDRYHHTYAWNLACKALLDEDVDSISLEDKDGGAFDDVVIRRKRGPDEFYQLKSSNFAGTVVDSNWLMTSASPKGKSPLQRYYATYKDADKHRASFRMIFVANRSSRPGDAMLDLLDLLTSKIDTSRIREAKPLSGIGKGRGLWAEHLDVSMDELLAFLGATEWILGVPESAWIEHAKANMALAGLRDDHDAVIIGREIVAEWVVSGVGRRSGADLLEVVKERGLVARATTLSLVVSAVDHSADTSKATVAVDLVDLFDGNEDFTRRRLLNPDTGLKQIAVELKSASSRLEREPSRRVQISGTMRLPLYFAVGRELPKVRGWTLSLEYHGAQWSTDDAYIDPVSACIRTVQTERAGEDLAVGIALTSDVDEDIAKHISTSGLGCPTIFIAMPPDGHPGQRCVESSQWLNAWIDDARPRLSEMVRSARAVHLFMAAPAPAALLLGHNWNNMPPTILYDFDRGHYYPAGILP